MEEGARARRGLPSLFTAERLSIAPRDPGHAGCYCALIEKERRQGAQGRTSEGPAAAGVVRGSPWGERGSTPTPPDYSTRDRADPPRGPERPPPLAEMLPGLGQTIHVGRGARRRPPGAGPRAPAPGPPGPAGPSPAPRTPAPPGPGVSTPRAPRPNEGARRG